MKRNRILGLCALLCTATVFLACGESAPTQGEGVTQASAQTDVAVTEAVTESRDYPSYEYDLGGADVSVYAFDAVTFCGWSTEIPLDIDQETLTGDILSDSVYNRNRQVESIFNCHFTVKNEGSYDIAKNLIKSVHAGDGAYDIFYPDWQNMGTLVSNGVLLPLDDLIDTSKPWWDEKSKTGFSFCGNSYALTGDCTYMDKLCDIVLFYNKNMAEIYDLGDIYQSVLDRTWTFDKMLDICKALSADLNSDGKYDKNDRFGFAGQNDATYEFYNAAGERYCTFDGNGTPYFSATSDRAMETMMNIATFMQDKQNFFNRQTAGLSVSEAITMFIEDRVFILMRPLQTVFELRSMKADFGIIPTPLMDSTQKDYYTSIGYTVAIAATIPTDAKNPAVSAAILDTLAAESYYSVNPVLYETVLGSKVTRDDTSAQNLELIFSSHIYDPGCIYSFGGFSNQMLTGTVKADKIASTVAKYEAKVQKDIDKMMETVSAQ